MSSSFIFVIIISNHRVIVIGYELYSKMVCSTPILIKSFALAFPLLRWDDFLLGLPKVPQTGINGSKVATHDSFDVVLLDPLAIFKFFLLTLPS